MQGCIFKGSSSKWYNFIPQEWTLQILFGRIKCKSFSQQKKKEKNLKTKTSRAAGDRCSFTGCKTHSRTTAHTHVHTHPRPPPLGNMGELAECHLQNKPCRVLADQQPWPSPPCIPLALLLNFHTGCKILQQMLNHQLCHICPTGLWVTGRAACFVTITVQTGHTCNNLAVGSLLPTQWSYTNGLHCLLTH